MKPPRFAARISTRLLVFNLLLVFLPVAGSLYLGAYESRLETAEIRAMTDDARLLASMLSANSALDAGAASDLLRRWHTDVRFRILDGSGRVVADTRAFAPAPPQRAKGSPRHNTLYRIGAFIVR